MGLAKPLTLKTHEQLQSQSANDHHPAPTNGIINNTSQVISGGSTYTMNIALPESGYKNFLIMIRGVQTNNRDTAMIVGGDSIDETQVHAYRFQGSILYPSYAQIFESRISSTKLTQRRYDNTGANIYLREAYINGTNLRLHWGNYTFSNRTLWVKGTWTAW